MHFWQSPMGWKSFCESLGEVSAHPWGKEKKSQTYTLGKRDSFTLSASPLKTAQLSAKYTCWRFLPWWKVRACEWAPDFPSSAFCQFFSIQNTKVCCVTGDWEELGEQQPWLSGDIKGIQILPTAWWTPSERQSMTLWKASLWDPPNCSPGSPNALCISSAHTHKIWLCPCVCPASTSLCR